MDAEFRAVLAIRQSHGFLHGKSDLFFGVALQCALFRKSVVPVEKVGTLSRDF